MHTKFTRKRLKKFLSYYKPHRRIFAMDMSFAALSAISVLLFPLLSGKITGLVMGTGDGSQAGVVYPAAGRTDCTAGGQQCDLCLLRPRNGREDGRDNAG